LDCRLTQSASHISRLLQKVLNKEISSVISITNQ
jgi:hypothetical protein